MEEVAPEYDVIVMGTGMMPRDMWAMSAGDANMRQA